MNALRRYRVPATRLPFVNAEIAEVEFQGAPHLVSSVWAGPGGARLYFWNPETRAHAMRPLPPTVPGAYMLRTGPDGRLYLGCGNGTLLRYDGRRDVFETLVQGELNGITWGGIVTDRFVFWNASRQGRSGAVGVYDWREGRLVKVFDPLDSETPTALYGHRTALAPDGRILWAMNVPQSRLILIDPRTMTAQSFTPPWMVGGSFVSASFIAEARLAVFVGRGEERTTRLFIVGYPNFEMLAQPQAPLRSGPLKGHAFRVGRHLYYTDENDLHRLDVETLEYETVAPGWTGGNYATLGLWRKRDIAAVTVYGEALRYRVADGGVDRLDLNAVGPVPVHSLCAVPEEKLIVGSPFINQRFWTIDMRTGEGIDRGRAAPGGGQVNQILWDPLTRRVLMSSYTSASISAWDPARGGAWPENPVLLAAAEKQGQMRPMALVHDGRQVWMATSPAYGTLGGALCRLDPRTGAMEVRPHIVRDQRPVSLALDVARKRLFFSTDVYADCQSAPATETTARVACVDIASGKVLAWRSAPEGHPSLRIHLVLPDGRALMRDGEAWAHWDGASGAIEAVNLPASLVTVLSAPDGRLIGATSQDVGAVALESASGRYTPRLALAGARFLQVAGGGVFCVVAQEVVEAPLSALLQ